MLGSIRRQVYFCNLMCAIVIGHGQDFHVKFCDIVSPIDRDRGLKVIISNGSLFLAAVLHIFSAAHIFAVFHHLGQNIQKRQLLRRQVGIADDLARNIAVDIHGIRLALKGDAGYRHIFCRLEYCLVGVLQCGLEAFPRHGSIQPLGAVDPVLCCLYAAFVHRDGGGAFLCLHGGLSLIGALNGGHTAHLNRACGGLCGCFCRRGIHTRRLRFPGLYGCRGGLGAACLSPGHVHRAACAAQHCADGHVMDGLTAVKAGGGIIGCPLQNRLEHRLHKFLAALAQGGRGHTSGRRLGQLGHRFHCRRFPKPGYQLPGQLLRRTRAKRFCKRCRHVGDLLRGSGERSRPQAIGQLLPIARTALPCLLRAGAKCPNRHGDKRTSAGQQGKSDIPCQLCSGYAHIHGKLPQVSQPLLGLRNVRLRGCFQLVRRVIKLLCGLHGPLLLGLRGGGDLADHPLIPGNHIGKGLPFLLGQRRPIQLFAGIQHLLIPGIVLPELADLGRVVLGGNGCIQMSQPLNE